MLRKNPTVLLLALSCAALTVHAESITTLVEAEHTNGGASGIVWNGWYIGSCDNGNWAAYSEINLRDGATEMRARIASGHSTESHPGNIEIRLDAVDGRLIGRLSIAGTGSWSNWEIQEAVLDGATGTHDIYLVFVGVETMNGLCDMDWFEIDVDDDPTPPPPPGNVLTLEAEHYSAEQGTQIIWSPHAVGHIDNGDWLRYDNVDLFDGAVYFTATLASDQESGMYTGAVIEIRVDGIGGELLGFLEVKGTGSWSTYVQQSAVLNGAGSGVHDLYLAFYDSWGICNLDKFSITRSDQAAEMVSIDARGYPFFMGPEGSGAEHTVTFGKDFLMDKTEVTQADYANLMGVNPSDIVGDALPVNSVTWYDAVLYCNERSKRDGYDTVYSYTGITGVPGNNGVLDNVEIHYDRIGYRLPTEAEWEYACRAGTHSSYYWGNWDSPDNPDYMWSAANSGGSIQPVEQLYPNQWGLFDMSGNAREWCNDWYGAAWYNESNSLDPIGPSAGDNNDVCIRGGCFKEQDWFHYSRKRNAFERTRIDNGNGFRCILPQEAPGSRKPLSVELDVNGTYRTATVWPSTTPTESSPVVFYFHGYGGYARDSENGRQFHTLWPEATVLYLNGLGEPAHKKQGWQEGIIRHPDNTFRENIQIEIDFIDAMLTYLNSNFLVDNSRIYASGHSNGSFLTRNLANLTPETFDAFASVASYSYQDPPVISADPKPYLYVVGRNDHVFDNDYPGYQPTLERYNNALYELLVLNDCPEPGDPDYWDTPHAVFAPNPGGEPVEYRLHEGDHSWPSSANQWVIDFFMAQ